MYGFEVKRIVSRYNLGDEISLYANGVRANGILVDYDDDYIKIKCQEDETLMTLEYSDVEDI